MTNTTHSFRNAGSAIAAALALASTPSLAQDASAPFPTAPAPVILVPDIPVPAAPPPSMVMPPQTIPAPPVETVQAIPPQPEPSASAATPTRTRAVAPVTERTAPQPASAPRVETTAPDAVEETAALPPVIAPEPVAEPVVPVAAERPAATAQDNTGIVALILGGLAFLALAIWGFVAIGRRKPVRRYAAPKPAARAVPVAVRGPVAVEPELPIVHQPAAAERLSEHAFATRPAAPAASLSHTGAAVALPSRVPESFAERDALMKRMIDARPDRANPFTDRGARTRRARLILQSLGRDFGETEPWIDLSQYPSNWPELARKRSAAA